MSKLYYYCLEIATRERDLVKLNSKPCKNPERFVISMDFVFRVRDFVSRVRSVKSIGQFQYSKKHNSVYLLSDVYDLAFYSKLESIADRLSKEKPSRYLIVSDNAGYTVIDVKTKSFVAITRTRQQACHLVSLINRGIKK